MPPRNLFPLMHIVMAAVFAAWIGVVQAVETTTVPAAPLRLAILPTEVSPETKNLADLLILELQKADADIVERVELDRVLKEQSLTAAGLAGATAGRVALGKLLRADGFLFVGKTAAGDRLSARLVETRHGYQVCQMLFRTNELNLISLASSIAASVTNKLPVLRLADDKRILIGVLRIGNATLDPRLVWIEGEAPLLLSSCLSAHPSVLTLERRELGALLDETLMTGGERAQFRTADLLIDGDVFLASGEILTGQDHILTMVLRVRNGQLHELLRLELKGKASELERTIAGLASELLGKLDTLQPGADNLASAEPAVLLDVAKKQGGVYGGGFWAVQAAYALEATNTIARKLLIDGLVSQGRNIAFDSRGGPIAKRKAALESARLLLRAADLILSAPDPASMPSIIFWNTNIEGAFARKYRNDAEITELLRPIRALGRVELERDYIPSLKDAKVIFSNLFWLFENDAEEAAYTVSLMDRIKTDSTLTPYDRQMRMVIMLKNLRLPSSLYETFYRMDDPVVSFFARLYAGQFSASYAERQANYRKALGLLDGLFDNTGFLKQQAAARFPGNHYFYDAVKTLHESGADMGREVESVLVRHVSGWLATNDLATLGDVLAYNYFPMLDPETAADLQDKMLLAREKEGVRLPTSGHGIKMLKQMTIDRENNKRKSQVERPLQQGDKIVLLTPQSIRWKEMGGDVYWLFGNNNMALTPQRLRVDGTTLWVALGGFTSVYTADRYVGSLIYSKWVVTTRTALLQMDLATGRMVSYRLEERKKPELRDVFALSPIFAWRDNICFAENGVGLYLFPRTCETGERTFDRVRRIDMTDGLPSLDIKAAVALGDTVYLGLPTLLLALPGGKGPPRSIAVIDTETANGPLAGAGRIIGLMADEKADRLFILTDGSNETNKQAVMWRYTPRDGSFVRLPEKPNQTVLTYCRGMMSSEAGTVYLSNHKFGDSTHGYMVVNGCFHLDDESLTTRPTVGLPPATYPARYDCVPYRGGSIAIGGLEKEWELAFFMGKQTTDVNALSWALENTPPKEAPVVKTRAKADALYAACLAGDSKVRLQAAADLNALGDYRATEVQIRLLQDPDRNVRLAMVTPRRDHILLSNPGAIPLDVFHALLTDEDPNTAGSVAVTLANITDPRSKDPLLKALKAWVLLNRTNGCSRDACLGDVIELIGGMLTGRFEDARAIEPLKQALGSDCENIREGAVRALGDLRDLRTVDLLLPMLDDIHTGVRKAAILALAKIDDPRVTPALEKQLQSKSAEVRAYAEEMLKKRPS